MQSGSSLAAPQKTAAGIVERPNSFNVKFGNQTWEDLTAAWGVLSRLGVTWLTGADQMARQRASWDRYFMDIAQVVASRSTCDRKHVGAVIVRDRTILSTGYNGSIRGMPHCSEVGHMIEDDHCVATLHAEQNAIIHAAKNGVSIDGADIYVTASPCWSCFKSVANSGIKRIVFGEFYRDARIFEVARHLGIELLHMSAHADSPAAAELTADLKLP
jgi:dCMP deaminase